MAQAQELIEKPLSGEELAERYRALCDDPCFTNVPGKIELDVWGRVLMTPPSAYHGRIQGRLSQKLAALGGTTFVEAPIVTPAGLFLADVAWASAAFLSAHRSEISLTRAPEICIEVVSPSNSVKELEEKKSAYLAAGAEEVWIVTRSPNAASSMDRRDASQSLPTGLSFPACSTDAGADGSPPFR